MADKEIKIVASLDEEKSTARIANQIPNLTNKINNETKNLNITANIDFDKSKHNISKNVKEISNELRQSILKVSSQKIAMPFQVDMKNSDNFKKQIEGMISTWTKGEGILQDIIISTKTQFNQEGQAIEELDKAVVTYLNNLGKINTKTIGVSEIGFDEQGNSIRGFIELSGKYSLATENMTANAKKFCDSIKNYSEQNDRYLNKQKIQLESLKFAFTDKSQSKAIKQENGSELSNVYLQAENAILEYKGRAEKLSAEEINLIEKSVQAYRQKATVIKNTEYVATSLRTKDFDTVIETSINDFKKFHEEVKNSKIDVKTFKDELDTLSIYSNKGMLIDSKDLIEYLNMLDVAKSKAKVAKEEQKGLNQSLSLDSKKTFEETKLKNYQTSLKQLGLLTDDLDGKISKLQIDLAGIDSNADLSNWKNEFNSLDSFVDVEKIKNKIKSLKATLESTTKENVLYLNNLNNNDRFVQNSNSPNVTITKNKISDLIVKYEDFEKKIGSGDLSFKELNDLKVELSSLQEEFKRTTTQTNRFLSSLMSAEEFQAFNANVTKSRSGLEKFVTQNSKLLSDPKLTQRLKELQNFTIENPQQLKQFNIELATFKNNVEIAGKSGESFSDTLKNAVEKFGTWMLAGTLTMEPIDCIELMITNIKELDKAMTELKKVTDETDVTYNNFLTSASNNAKKLGSSLSDMVNATADFARLGFNIQDAEKLAQTAIIYKNVGEGIEDVGQASESIISSMAAFNISASDSMKIIDKFNKVGNEFPISSTGIGEALKESASALKVAGNDINQSIGLIVAGNIVEQDPNKVGNALKTVALRLTNTKGKLEELGEESDGAAESVTKLQTQLLNLTKGKVNIMASPDEFKKTYDIMLEMSKVWDTMTQKDQSTALELIAGKRQANIVASAIQNMGEGQKAMETAVDSAGSALAENDKYLDSIEGRTSQLKASIEDFSKNVINNELIKGVILLSTKFVDLMNLGGGFVGILTAITASVIGLRVAIKAGKLTRLAGRVKMITLLVCPPQTDGNIERVDYRNGVINKSLCSKQLKWCA